MERTSKNGAASRRWIKAPVLVVLTMLAVLAGWYFLSYVPSQQRFYTHRNLRVLALASDQLKTTTENLPKALTLAARSVEKIGPLSGDPPTNQIFHSNTVRKAMNLISILSPTSVQVTNSPAASAAPSPFTFRTTRDAQGSWLEVSATNVVNTTNITNLTVSIQARGDFNKLLEARAEFDGLLLARATGEVIFERSPPPGLRIESLTEWMPGKAGGTNRFPRVSQVLTNPIAGESYLLFVQPVRIVMGPSDGEQQEWLLCGFVRGARFAQEARALPHVYLIVVIFLLLFSVINLPFLKIWLAPPTDRLRRREVWWLLLSGVVGGALLSVLLLDAALYYKWDEQDSSKRLQDLASKISQNFTDELGAVEEQLRQLDESNSVPAVATNETNQVVINVLASSALFNLTNSPYPYFSVMQWIGSNGMQIRKWTANPIVTPLTSVKDRAYFRDAKDDRRSVYSWDRSGHTNHLWLEPIYPYYGGEVSVVMSLARTNEVVAIETRLHSLVRPVLPPSYGFSVITEEGRVLFHSDHRRNLREDFFSECEDSTRLRMAVNSRATNELELVYLGNTHDAVVTPLPGLRWSLVVFRDERLVSAINFDVVLASFASLAAYFGAALLLGSLVGGLFWLFRDAGAVLWFGAPALLLLAVLVFGPPMVWPLTLHALAWIVAVILVKWFPEQKFPGASSDKDSTAFWYCPDPDRKFEYDLLAVINLVLAAILVLSLTWWPELVARVWVATAASVLGLVGNSVVLRWRWLATPAEKLTSFASGHPNLARILGRRTNPDHSARSCYTLVLASLLALVAAVPAFAAFMIASDLGERAVVKHGIFHLAESIFDRAERVTQNYRDVQVPGSRAAFLNKRLNLTPGTNDPVRDLYTKFFYGTDPATTNALPPTAEAASDMEESLSWVFDRFLSMNAATSGDLLPLPEEMGGDPDWQWKEDAGQVALQRNRYRGDQALFLKASVEGWTWQTALPALVMLVLLLMVPARFIARHVFPVEVKKDEKFRDTSQASLERGRHLLVMECPKDDPLRSRMEAKLQGQMETQDWSVRLDEAALLQSDKPFLVIHHFEHRNLAAQFNRQKLQCLEKLLAQGRHTVIVFTTVDPFAFKFTETPVTSDKDKRPPDERSRADRWREALSALERVYQPLPLVPEQVRRDLHRSLWAISTEDERVALYHLAKDELVHPRNPALPGLLARGLVRNEGNLRLLNTPFLEFVKDAIDQQTLGRYERKVAAENPWQAIRGPLTAGLVIVVLVLFYTQRDLLSSFVGVLTAVVGVVGVLAKVFPFPSGDRPDG